MIYRSNLLLPVDLQPGFSATTICSPMPHSHGHSVLRDKEYERNCGFITHDEAAILYHCALRVRGKWIDIGSRFGWSTAHIALSGSTVFAVDQDYKVPHLLERARTNLRNHLDTCLRIVPVAKTSDEYFADLMDTDLFAGVMIDGNHDSPCPLNDAKNAVDVLCGEGVIVLHDFWGKPIQDAVNYLIDEGMKCRVYNTPNGMAVCSDFEEFIPEHVADPTVDWATVRRRCHGFNFERTI